MKLVGIVGSAAEKSYNRQLLQFIKKQFANKFDLDIIEIKDLPLFNQSEDISDTPLLQDINQRILDADGVIISTPEHNHTIPAALKSALEWLSFNLHPLANKPVMIVGASYYDQGSSRAQLNLRQVLDAPGVNAHVLPGNEFLLGLVKEAFDEEGNIKAEGTVGFLSQCIDNFLTFVRVVNTIDAEQKAAANKPAAEDLNASGKIATTIESVDMHADDWVEQAAAKVNAVEGDTYVKLNRGVLTVDQINMLLESMPMEITYADSNNQFLYYNMVKPASEMLAKRVPGQVGNPLADCHPPKSLKNVEWVIQTLRSGQQDVVRVHVPKHADKYVVHNYQAIKDTDGQYMGINEYILDFKPIVEWYLKQTGQELVGGVDVTTSASQKEESPAPDTTSSASISEEEPAVAEVETDTTSSASYSEEEEKTVEVEVNRVEEENSVDAITGASEA